jgi:hypothetical protein
MKLYTLNESHRSRCIQLYLSWVTKKEGTKYTDTSVFVENLPCIQWNKHEKLKRCLTKFFGRIGQISHIELPHMKNE